MSPRIGIPSSGSLHATPSTWELDGPDGRVSVDIRGPLQVNNSIALREAAGRPLGV